MQFSLRPLVAGCGALGAIVTLAAAQDTPRVYRPGDGVSPPAVVREVKPEYSKEAKDARIQGAVTLDTVVLEDGTVGEVNVTRSLDSEHGLDQQAIKAMKQWLFKPATKDGKSVAVRIEIEMTFTLR